jgi:hypothetical protein
MCQLAQLSAYDNTRHSQYQCPRYIAVQDLENVVSIYVCVSAANSLTSSVYQAEIRLGSWGRRVDSGGPVQRPMKCVTRLLIKSCHITLTFAC